MGPNKYVHLLFGFGGLLLAFLLGLTIEWIWGYFAKPPDLAATAVGLLLGLIATIIAYRSDKLFTGAQEVVRELEKVTWPTRKETSAATVVVIITVTIASLILSGFDAIWSYVTGRILG